MSIEKYLNLTRDFIYDKDQDIDFLKSVIHNFYDEFNIELIVINSTLARNEVVIVKDRNYLIWDERFWIYYHDHLYKLLILDENFENHLILEQYMDFLISDPIRFVTEKLRYYDKVNAIILAKYYVSRFKKTCEINFSSQSFETIFLLSKLYVLNHECSHIKYRNKNTNEYIIRENSTINTVKMIKKTFSAQMLDVFKADNLYTVEELSQLLDSFANKSDEKTLEELVFDTIAFSNCLIFWHNAECNGNYDELAEKLPILVNSIRVIRSFSKMLKLFELNIKLILEDEKNYISGNSKELLNKFFTRDQLNLFSEQIQTITYFMNKGSDYSDKIGSAFVSDEYRPYKFINEKFLYPYIEFVIEKVLLDLLHDKNAKEIISKVRDKDKMIDYLLLYNLPKST